MSTSVPAQQIIPVPLYCKSTIIQLKNRYLKINGSWGDQLLFCRVSRIMFALNFFHLCNYIWEPNRSLKIPKTPENQDFPGCLLESFGGGNWCTADLYRKLRLPSQSPLGAGICWKGIIKFSRPWKFSPWCTQTAVDRLVYYHRSLLSCLEGDTPLVLLANSLKWSTKEQEHAYEIWTRCIRSQWGNCTMPNSSLDGLHLLLMHSSPDSTTPAPHPAEMNWRLVVEAMRKTDKKPLEGSQGSTQTLHDVLLQFFCGCHFSLAWIHSHYCYS